MQAPLGDALILARRGDRRLHVLDAPAAVLWALNAGGHSPRGLAALVSERFGLPLSVAHTHITNLMEQWFSAGLLAAWPPVPGQRFDEDTAPPWLPFPTLAPADAWVRRVADRRVALQVDADELRTLLEALRDAREGAEQSACEVDHRLRLQGGAGSWHLFDDDRLIAQGRGADAAAVATLIALTELGSRPAERLLVIHGAGLVNRRGSGLLLIAPGGSGKTTLAAALNADGYGLLSDDVVPVTLDGALLSLNLPLCLKSRSWPVLLEDRPELVRSPIVERFGQRVRFLQARGPALTCTVRPARLLFPRYAPDEPARVAPLSPVEALQGIINAEAVIRDLTQAKLEGLARWIEALPAFSLTYPDLASAREQVAACLHTAAGEPP